MRMGNANTSAGAGAGDAPSSSSSPSSDSNPCTPSSLHYNGLHPYSKQFVQAHRAGAPSDDRDVGWKGTSGGTDTSGRWKEEEEENGGGVPVFVMLPLDTVRMVEDKESETPRWALSASLAALKSCGVQGVMVDVWWGLVEKDAPGAYDWLAYSKLFHLVRCSGLTIQAVMSFHQCGSNVGDSCCIPLPDWVVDEIDKNPEIVYTDRSGNRNYEYISLGCDTLPVLQGRTPVQVYADFMTSFRDYFRELFGEHGIVEIQVGMGPAGELRYPSYPEGTDQWRYPGIGEFQCFDKYMLASLKEQAASSAAGSEDESWGVPPTGTGGYNHLPEATPFFRADNGGWTTPRGHFFLTWYADVLLAHGDRLLSAAAAVFRATGAHLSGKVSGIHWHYGTASHAAELTAGYYNTAGRDGYLPIAQLFARHGARLTFTCMEMTDREQAQPAAGSSRPEGLVAQVAAAVAATPGARLAGENALARFDRAGLEQVVKQARRLRRRRRRGSAGAGDGNDGGPRTLTPPDDKQQQQQQLLLESFTYLRLCHHLFVPHNWTVFVAFVKSMRVARPSPTSNGDDDDDDTARIHHP